MLILCSGQSGVHVDTVTIATRHGMWRYEFNKNTELDFVELGEVLHCSTIIHRNNTTKLTLLGTT